MQDPDLIEDYFPLGNTFKEIISSCPFSTNSHLSDQDKLVELIRDWLRFPDNICFGEKPLGKIFAEATIDAANETTKEINYRVRNQFKLLLSEFIPDYLHRSPKILGDLASVLHQGGIVSRMDKHIEGILTDREMLFDSQKKITRRAYLTATPTGFLVKNLFVCSANIVQKQDVDEKAFAAKGDILSAQCEHNVSFDKSGKMSVEVSSASIYSPAPELIKLMCTQTKEEVHAANPLSPSVSFASLSDEYSSPSPLPSP